MSNCGRRAFDSGATRHCRTAARAFAAGIALARRLLPQRCTLCLANAGGALLCRACDEALPRLSASCPVCALPSPSGVVCGACKVRPPPYARTVASLIYDYPVDRLLQRFKYRGELALADWAAASLAAAVRAGLDQRAECERPDRVVALPLAESRQRERGFNQAREIAECVGRALALPRAPVLMRIAAGPPQAGLPWQERRHNVLGAFAVQGDIRGARLALVDDVMTTGATLAEAASVLRRAGAARVECWVVARTLPPAHDTAAHGTSADPVARA